MRTLIVNGYVIDPASDREGPMNLLMDKGIIEAIGETGTTLPPAEIVDVSGCFVVPGFVDLQVNPGKGIEHIADILPLKGITTGVFMPCEMSRGESLMDVYGGPEGFVKSCARQACNIVPSLPVVPEDAVGHTAYEKFRVPREQMKDRLKTAIEQGFGAIGEAVLSLGGPAHVRSSICREFLDRLLDFTTNVGIPVQVHTGLGLEGIRQALEIAGERTMHLCHVGSTCASDDIHEALRLLSAYPNVSSDTHLSEVAGSTSKSSDLVKRYFDRGKVVKVNEKNLETTPVNDLEKEEPPFYYGKENLFTNNLICAVSSNIDAIESDELGDGVRSRLLLKNILRLVNTAIIHDQKMEMLKRIIAKLTINPAKILKITGGSLEEGFPADVVVLDLNSEAIVHVWVNGTKVVSDGCFTKLRPGKALSFVPRQ